jgi:hypothetical protein
VFSVFISTKNGNFFCIFSRELIISVHNSSALANLLHGLDQISIYFVFFVGFGSNVYQFFSISSMIFGLGMLNDPVMLKELIIDD